MNTRKLAFIDIKKKKKYYCVAFSMIILWNDWKIEFQVLMSEMCVFVLIDAHFLPGI